MFKRFQIENFRNIHTADIELSPSFNIIIGGNGAGKTSLLEALTFMARGQSFRTKNISSIINAKSEYFQLIAELESRSILGIRRYPNDMTARMNGETVTKLSRLAEHLPLFLITPNSHELLESGPEYRRRFIDWGLFHIDPRYGKITKEYRRILKQRNAALQRSRRETDIWAPALIRSAESIDQYRKAYLTKITPLFLSLFSRLTDPKELTLSYHSGWRHGASFAAQLSEKYQLDEERGYTSVGPHRADIVLRFGNTLAREVLSRGQQKIAVIALILAQATLASSGRVPILLIDDLTSELDHIHLARLIQYIRKSSFQSIMTSVSASPLSLMPDSRVFHVEHGELLLEKE